MEKMESGRELTQLTEKIIHCLISVHRTLGPGFLEGVYQRALVLQLRASGLFVEVEKEIAIHYLGELVGKHRLDLVVEQRVLLELKTVEAFSKAHYAQVRSYLKASRLATAILVNYSMSITQFRRIDG